MHFDLFLSHASEDKPYVVPLAAELTTRGYRVWLDSTELKLGDSLTEKIDEGLANSRFGIVILSTHFFAKQWPKRELSGLVAREMLGARVIIPIWHEIDHSTVAHHSPPLADRVAVLSSAGLETVCDAIQRAVPLPDPPNIPAKRAATPASDAEEQELATLRASYDDDEVCPRCGQDAEAFGFDGSDGDAFDWLECSFCHLILPLGP